MACRVTDGTIGPPNNLLAAQAPFRKALMVARPSGEVQVEANWENWSMLSKRQLIRPSHACRLNITMFARNHEAHQLPRASEESLAPEPSAPRAVTFQDQQMPSVSPEVSIPETDSSRVPDSERTLSARTTSQESETTANHGINFLKLPKWEQAMLLQMHPNLGHPTN